MTQSSKDENTIVLTNMDGTTETINLGDLVDFDSDITIDLSQTYGATTTYLNDSSYTISGATDTITIGDNTFTNSNDWINSITINDTRISPEEIEKMCKEYPGLEKVWRNFKSVYDMCKQDYEGKKKAGEIDDDELPF